MIRTAAIAALLAGPVWGQTMPVPSGLEMTFDEVILGPDSGFARFRFVAPEVGAKGFHFDRVAGDFAWLCSILALPALQRSGWDASQIVVSIADRSVPFGAIDPDATQFFEGFSIQADACQWEPF